MKLCLVFPVVFAAFIAGCAADTTNEVTDEGTAEAASDLTGKTKHHYSPSVQDVTWHPEIGRAHV